LVYKELARIKGGEKDDIKGERYDYEIPSEPID
jgi:hypothetical protein